MARVLEAHMTDRTFIVADTVKVGDFVVAYTLDWAKAADLLSEHPRLEGYMERMYARPCAPMSITEALASVGR
jgi:glutathione S-transferase